MSSRKIAVIGGGASGMMAAITAAGYGASVTLYERNERLGKKILATGNGKCNLGNRKLSAEDYYGGSREFIENCLKRFGTEDTVDFFQGLGLLIKERNGYLYPLSEQASSVLDVLRMEVAARGIRVIVQAKVNCLEKNQDGRLTVGYDDSENGGKQREEYDRVIIACGSKAAPRTGSDGSGYKLAKQLGLEQVSVVPALVQLKCREEYCKAIAGVRANAVVHIMDGKEELAVEEGELQLTDYGISGIPVFQLSRIVNYRLRQVRELTAVIDFLPEYEDEEYEKLIRSRWESRRHRTVEDFFTGMLNRKLMQLFCRLAGCRNDRTAAETGEERIREVFRLCREFPLHITGSNSYDNAQVCAGGVALTELTQDLEVKKVPGVYLAGEVLDVDGRCGGYNLQWAWSSGYLAGRAAAGENYASPILQAMDEL